MAQTAPVNPGTPNPPPSSTKAMSFSPNFHKLITKARRLAFLPPKPISPRNIKEQDAPLCQIPPDLRQMIWEAYYGGRAVHLYGGFKRIRATECTRWDADDASPGPHFGVCSKAGIRLDCISLLLTCKKMYISCLIYSHPSIETCANKYVSATLNVYILSIERPFSTSRMALYPSRAYPNASRSTSSTFPKSTLLSAKLVLYGLRRKRTRNRSSGRGFGRPSRLWRDSSGS